MFPIFGLRMCFRAVGRGTFHCQRCGGDRPYLRRSGRRWIHAFLIPVVPLAAVGEHVWCTICRTAYRVEVLAVPTVAQMRAALAAGMHAAATAMIRVGDPASVPARRRAIAAIAGAGQAGFDDAALDAGLARPAGADVDTSRPLGRLAVQLAIPAREWFLAEIVRIGLADGMLTHEERHAATQIAQQLGMTPAQAGGVISMTEEGATAE
jgi:hypothetical protein